MSRSPRRLRVTFTGFERFWMDVLVKAVSQRYADEIDCRWVLWPSTLAERVRFVWAALTSDVVVRVGMPFEFASETNKVWLSMLRLVPWLRGVNYWIGSDVMLLGERVASGAAGPRERAAVARMSHFAGSAHLREELAGLGVEARTVILPSPEREVPDSPPPFPATFRVLAYLHEPEARFAFYGGPALLAAARALPEVGFDIVGSADPAAHPDAPPNVAFHGVVREMDPLYEGSVVLARLVEHDGVPSGMVEEALVFGRYVLYSCRWPHTSHVEFGDTVGLMAALRELKQAFDTGGLPLNLDGRAFTLEDWDPERRAAELRAALLEVAGRR